MYNHLIIDDAIRATRLRMRYGQTKEQIAKELGKHFHQEILFLAYAAAKILENAK